MVAVSDNDQDSDTPLLWESCWTPILSAMAEGCSDSRKPVRLAASNALCAAIMDRHVKNVPVGLMVKILGDVYIATILKLAEFLVRETEVSGSDTSRSGGYIDDDAVSNNTGDPASRRNSNKEISKKTKDVRVRSESRSGDKSVEQSSAAEGADSILTVIPTLSITCKVFADQLKRFSSYPSFDRLWLRLIHVFGYFLGSPYGFDHTTHLPPQHRIPSCELHRTVIVASEQLSTLINLLVKSGIFRERSGLWLVTKDSLQQMKHCPPDLLSDSTKGESLSPTTSSSPSAVTEAILES